jgi:hypothetical protein
MLVTLILLSISLAAVMTVFANYLERTTAQRARVFGPRRRSSEGGREFAQGYGASLAIGGDHPR